MKFTYKHGKIADGNTAETESQGSYECGIHVIISVTSCHINVIIILIYILKCDRWA